MDGAGHVTPVGAYESGECFDVYALGERCGGGCVARARPDCAACDACDLSCAGDPLAR